MKYKKIGIGILAGMFLGTMGLGLQLFAAKGQSTLEQVVRSRLEEAKQHQDFASVLLLLDIINKAIDSKSDYNLCDLPTMCRDNIGINRINMPQLGGFAVPGSPADELPKNKYGGVDAKEQFANYLINERGFNVTAENVPAADLKATQDELVGSKVAGIWWAMQDPNSPVSQEINNDYIFISKDNYILDGHHRWAAVLGDAFRKGRLKDTTIRVKRIDADIKNLVPIAMQWTKDFGIQVAKGL